MPGAITSLFIVFGILFYTGFKVMTLQCNTTVINFLERGDNKTSIKTSFMDPANVPEAFRAK